MYSRFSPSRVNSLDNFSASEEAAVPKLKLYTWLYHVNEKFRFKHNTSDRGQVMSLKSLRDAHPHSYRVEANDAIHFHRHTPMQIFTKNESLLPISTMLPKMKG